MGIVGTHPGSFRKSGKYRTCGIRNLEEHTENGRGRIWRIQSVGNTHPPRFSELRILNNLWRRTRGSAHSKEVAGRRLRLKTGKTRCLPGTTHSKRLKGIAGKVERAAGGISELGDRGNGIGIRLRKEFGDRRGWDSTLRGSE
jgi:hypothetical protein